MVGSASVVGSATTPCTATLATTLCEGEHPSEELSPARPRHERQPLMLGVGSSSLTPLPIESELHSTCITTQAHPKVLGGTPDTHALALLRLSASTFVSPYKAKVAGSIPAAPTRGNPPAEAIGTALLLIAVRRGYA